jgi:hypothetical protein
MHGKFAMTAGRERDRQGQGLERALGGGDSTVAGPRTSGIGREERREVVHELDFFRFTGEQRWERETAHHPKRESAKSSLGAGRLVTGAAFNDQSRISLDNW